MALHGNKPHQTEVLYRLYIVSLLSDYSLFFAVLQLELTCTPLTPLLLPKTLGRLFSASELRKALEFPSSLK